MNRTIRTTGFMISALALVAGGCTCGEKKRGAMPTQIVQRSNVDAADSQVYIAKADDLALGLVVDAVQSGQLKATDANGIARFINDIGSDGQPLPEGERANVNNVDMDVDEVIDPIVIKELPREGQSVKFDVLACYTKGVSPGSCDKSETVGQLAFTMQNGKVQVSAGYADYVEGADSRYYQAEMNYQPPPADYRPDNGGSTVHHHHHGPSVGTMALYWWLFSPRPIYYARPMAFGYYSRPVVARSMITSRRTTYRTTRSITRSSRASRPRGYSISSAKQNSSRVRQQARRASEVRRSRANPGRLQRGAPNQKATLRDRANRTTQFRQRDAQKAKPSGRGVFGGKKSTPPRRAAPPPSRPKKSSGWGSSGGGRRRGGGFGRSRGGRRR